MLNFYNLHHKKLDKYDQLFDEIQKWNSHNYGHTFHHLPNIIKRIPRDAYLYARYIIKGRWIEAEPVIMKNPYYAYQYAKNVLQKRWPDAEPYIMNDLYRAYEYARDVIDGRWLEVEPLIMKDARYSDIYARDVIKERWLEAEQYMDKKGINYKFYKSSFNNNTIE
jgi:hypothetical protein